MSIIQITPESIRTQASTVRGYKSTHEQTMAKLKTLVLALSSDWKGEAQDAFVAKFLSMDSTYKKFASVLEEYASLMDKAASEMENTDQTIKGMIQRIG